MDSNALDNNDVKTTCSLVTSTEYQQKLLPPVALPDTSFVSIGKHYDQQQHQHIQQHEHHHQQQQHHHQLILEDRSKFEERQQNRELFVQSQYQSQQNQHLAFYQLKEHNRQKIIDIQAQNLGQKDEDLFQQQHLPDKQQQQQHFLEDEHQQQSQRQMQQLESHQRQSLHEDQQQQQCHQQAQQHELQSNQQHQDYQQQQQSQQQQSLEFVVQQQLKESRKKQQDIEKAQHCALEIFTSISHRVSDAAGDFYMGYKDSVEFAGRHQELEKYKSDHMPASSEVMALTQEPVSYPSVSAHSPVAVTLDAGAKLVSNDLPFSFAEKGKETAVCDNEEREKSRQSTQKPNTVKLSEDCCVEVTENSQLHFDNDDDIENIKDVALDTSIKKIPVPNVSSESIKIEASTGTETENILASQVVESQHHKVVDVQDRFEINDELGDELKDIHETKTENDEMIEIENNYICLCKEDFRNHANNKVKRYICGECWHKFVSVCHLHKHLEEHGSGGSYHFDHVSQTAYPKYDTFCSFTQTDNDDLMRQDESAVMEDMKSSVEEHNANKINELDNKSEIKEQKVQALRKSCRRKQDNPKPIKPRNSDLRKNERGKKGKRKAKVKDKVDSEYLIEYVLNDDSYQADSQATSLIENVHVDSFDVGNTGLANQDFEDKQDNKCIVVEQEVFEDGESSSAAKPFKKRGIPRQCGGYNEKTFVKKRKVMKKDKKAQKQQFLDRNENDTENDGLSKNCQDFMTESQERSEQGPDLYPEDQTNVTMKRKGRRNAAKEQICDVCGLYIPKYNYEYHMRRHTGEKPYVCDKCGKAFAHRRFLVKHLLTHAEDKPWKCDICMAQFCQKSEYNMHMNAHQGNRPHECKVCEMKFLSKAMLNTHQANVHMGITRFECEVCNRRFFKRSSLNVHQATHFEATLKCSFCDRMFKDRAGLKRHERIHTGEKRFRCHVCNHEFIQSTPYWVHMEKRHQMNRASVKNMLKGIRESNKRVGKRTEINVLPNDVDHLLVAQEKDHTNKGKSGKEDKKTASGKSVETSKSTESATRSGGFLQIPVFEQINTGNRVEPQKSYTNIKVPNIYSSNVPDLISPNTFTSVNGSESLTLQQHYRFVVPSQDPAIIHKTTSGPSSTPTQEAPVPSTQSLGLPLNPSLPVSLASLGLPMSSLNHGFIGLNPLQQALDFSSSLPNTGTYTDISSDRVTTQ